MSKVSGTNSAAEKRIPVTLVTGFLGAGKTTFLNAVLADTSVGRVAVIVNEFGEAGLDHDLIEHAKDEVVLMQSGCLCCSIRGDLARTIAELLDRKNNGEVAFERIVIETTGLADPAPIIQTLRVDPDLFSFVRLDGVVTLADAAAGPATLDAQFEAVSQVAMADMVVISKSDLVSETELQAFERRLGNLNPTARLLRASYGVVPTGSLWNLCAPDLVQSQLMLTDWVTQSAPSTFVDTLDNLSGFAPLSEPKNPEASMPHDQRIGSASIVLNEPISDVGFDLWLDTLVALRGPDLLRVKGIVFLENMDMPFAFHGIQHVFEPPTPLHNWTGTDRCSRIVVIARDMSRPELQRSLDMLRARMPRREADTNRE